MKGEINMAKNTKRTGDLQGFTRVPKGQIDYTEDLILPSNPFRSGHHGHDKTKDILKEKRGSKK